MWCFPQQSSSNLWVHAHGCKMLLSFHTENVCKLLSLVSGFSSHQCPFIRKQVIADSRNPTKCCNKRWSTTAPGASILRKHSSWNCMLHLFKTTYTLCLDDSLTKISKHRVVAFDQPNSIVCFWWYEINEHTTTAHQLLKLTSKCTVRVNTQRQWQTIRIEPNVEQCICCFDRIPTLDQSCCMEMCCFTYHT